MTSLGHPVLSDPMATEHFQRGQVIFREGDKSQEAYFIVSGLVEITLNTSHGVQSLAKIGPGEIFGEMGMIMDRPRTATATALENTTVETVAEAEFEQQIIQRPDRRGTATCRRSRTPPRSRRISLAATRTTRIGCASTPRGSRSATAGVAMTSRCTRSCSTGGRPA